MRQSRLARLAFVFGLVLVGVSSAYAQGGSATSSITGTVLDSSGGAIPGATVVVSDAAGGSFTAFTNAQGVFALPSMNPGTYTVTVTLSGFKTAVVSDVRLLPGQPFDVKVQLEIGQIEETITVATSAEIINTQTATVSSTLNADQLNRMPSVTRNALNAIVFLPGVNTPTTNRNSTVNGLPESFLYITLDGVTNQDNFNKTTDGFFASVYPRQDAVEAVTVTTAATGANQGGSGAVSINFVTRSGTNQYSGSAYEYYRNPAMNTNYWFNENAGLPKNEIRLHQFGGRFGGPIVANKAFFFAHYEHLRFPNSFTRTRTTFADEVLDGWFPRGQREHETRQRPATGHGQRPDLGHRSGRAAHAHEHQELAHDDRCRQRDHRPAPQQLRVAEPRHADRASTDGAPRRQSQRAASAERVRAGHLGHARPRLSQQRRRPLPRCAELSRVPVHPAPLFSHVAIDARRRHGQRGAPGSDGPLDGRIPLRPAR